MGMWGLGPTESDDAAELIGEIRQLLDEVWDPLRAGARDRAALDRATEAATIVTALGAFGVHVAPDDALDLGELDGVPTAVARALSTEWPRRRPPFGAEGAVEQHLRERDAPYELWNWAARFGDDRDAAWRAIADPDHLLAFAQAYGIAYEAIQRAIAACIVELAGGPEYAAPPFDPVPGILVAVARGDAVDAALLERCAAGLRTLNEARDQAWREALAAGRAPEATRDPRLGMFGLALDLARPRRRGVTRWVRPLHGLVEQVPDLTDRLREHLSP